MKLKSYEVFILGAAIATMVAAVVFGGHIVKAQSCTPGNMVVVGSGDDATCGPSVPVASFGAPNSRTLSLATAYQATDITKPAVVDVNLTSTANISLSGGTTNSASVVIGSTNAVSGGTGTTICSYSNSNTGTLTIGLNLNTIAATTCSFVLPVGWYFAIRNGSGTVTIGSAFDASMG